jgi:pilus assembly protein FimV
VLKTDKKSNFLKATAIAMAMAIIPLAGHAAGLGKVTVYSALGQPLKAEIEVSANSDELSSLQAKLASVDAFRQADIEYNPILSNLKFSRELIERNGRRYVQVTTDRPVNEPFINMLVELGWASGRLVREYTFLLDPPDLASATTAAPVSPTVVPPVTDKSQPEKTSQGESSPPSAVVTSQPAKVPAKVQLSVKASTPSAIDSVVKSHKVRAGDTLGKIAAKTRPEGVSLDQMLVALFNANKESFDGGNMNRLKIGKILAIPDAEAINQIPAREAKKEVIAQAADFNAYRKRMALAASMQTDTRGSEQHVAGGKITPKLEDAAPVPSGKDKLEVSKSENAKGLTSDAKGSAVEDKLAHDKALKEAQSRTAELEQNLSKLKQLAELKNKTGADLQQLAEEGKSPRDAASQVSAAVPAKVPEPTATTGDKTRTSAAETPHAEIPVSTPKPKADVKKAKALPIEPEPEPSFLEENSMLVLGGGGILALLLGWLGFSTWKKKKESNAPSGLDDGHSVSNFSTQSTFGPSIDSGGSSSLSPALGEPSASQFSISAQAAAEPLVDALSQADTFLAFGRVEQAEEVLNSALEAQPDRHELYLKLLGIYAEQNKTDAYESLAKRFREKTSGDSPDWETARAMGAAIDPQNALYQLQLPPSTEHKLPENVSNAESIAQDEKTAAPVQAVPDAVVESPSQTPDIQTIDTETLDFDLDFDLDDMASSAAKSDPVAPADLVAQPEMPALDFDLDLSLPEASSATKSDPVAPAALEAQPEMPALDFDLDLSLPEASSATPLDPVAKHDAPLDMSLSEKPGNSIDFDFDLPLADVPSASTHAANAPDLKLDTIDLDLDTDLSAPTFNVAGNDEAENSEVATKLELAAAYEEMGDNSGARELYQEALAEGNKAQQEFARTKLASLS